MYQLQNIDYLYRISTMTGSSKLVTVQADRDSHDLNDKHFVMLNLCRAIVNYANEGHVISAVYELEPDGSSNAATATIRGFRPSTCCWRSATTAMISRIAGIPGSTQRP